MVEIPHLLEDCSVRATAQVRYRAGLGLQGALKLGQGVRRSVRREDARSSQYVVRGIHFESADYSIEEVHDILVLLVVRAITCDVKG